MLSAGFQRQDETTSQQLFVRLCGHQDETTSQELFVRLRLCERQDETTSKELFVRLCGRQGETTSQQLFCKTLVFSHTTHTQVRSYVSEVGVQLPELCVCVWGGGGG